MKKRVTLWAPKIAGQMVALLHSLTIKGRDSLLHALGTIYRAELAAGPGC
jgi:hypothetical protein